MMKALLDKTPDAINAIRYVYDVRRGQYRDLSTGRFISPRDLPWPDNQGFVNPPVDTFLAEGTLLDRFGKLTGDFAGAPGTSISARGMAIGAEDMPYTVLRVTKPITVPSGTAAPVPEFGVTGGGTQYYFRGGIEWWINNGYLEVVNP